MTDKDYCCKKQEAEGAEIGEFGIGESGLIVVVRENEVSFDLNCKFLWVEVDWGGWWWWGGGSGGEKKYGEF